MAEEKDEKIQCLSVLSILNTGRGWGICIGIQRARPEAFYKDVIRLCAIKSHPKPGEQCPIIQGFALTPEEAINVGVHLIKATALGDVLLRKMEEEKSGTKQTDTP